MLKREILQPVGQGPLDNRGRLCNFPGGKFNDVHLTAGPYGKLCGVMYDSKNMIKKLTTEQICDKIIDYIKVTTGTTEFDYDAYDGFQGPDLWRIVENWYAQHVGASAAHMMVQLMIANMNTRHNKSRTTFQMSTFLKSGVLPTSLNNTFLNEMMIEYAKWRTGNKDLLYFVEGDDVLIFAGKDQTKPIHQALANLGPAPKPVFHETADGAEFCGLQVKTDPQGIPVLVRNLPKTIIKMGPTCKRVDGPERAAAMTLAKCAALNMHGFYAPSLVKLTDAICEDVQRIYPKETQRYQSLMEKWESYPEEMRVRVQSGKAPTDKIA